MRRIGYVVVVLCAVLGVSLAAASPAQAVRQVSQAETWTQANGPACGGFSTVSATSAPRLHNPDGSTVDNRGMVRFWVQGSFLGISGTPYPCDLSVRVHWRNLRTGAAGSFGGVVSGVISVAPGPGRGIERYVRTGSGAVEFRLVPALAHIAAPPAWIVVY